MSSSAQRYKNVENSGMEEPKIWAFLMRWTRYTAAISHIRTALISSSAVPHRDKIPVVTDSSSPAPMV